jgi:hypothetical protein
MQIYLIASNVNMQMYLMVLDNDGDNYIDNYMGWDIG